MGPTYLRDHAARSLGVAPASRKDRKEKGIPMEVVRDSQHSAHRIGAERALCYAMLCCF